MVKKPVVKPEFAKYVQHCECRVLSVDNRVAWMGKHGAASKLADDAKRNPQKPTNK